MVPRFIVLMSFVILFVQCCMYSSTPPSRKMILLAQNEGNNACTRATQMRGMLCTKEATVPPLPLQCLCKSQILASVSSCLPFELENVCKQVNSSLLLLFNEEKGERSTIDGLFCLSFDGVTLF